MVPQNWAIWWLDTPVGAAKGLQMGVSPDLCPRCPVAHFWKIQTHQRSLTPPLPARRRERNKMHAKATRERKKAFLHSMELAIEKVNQENLLLAKMLGTSDAPSIMTIMASMKRDPEIMAEEQEKQRVLQEKLEKQDQQQEQGDSPSGVRQSMTSSNLKQFNDMNETHSVSDDSSNAGSSSMSSHSSSSASSSSNLVQHHTISTSNSPSSPLSSGISTPSVEASVSDSSSDNSSVNVWESGGIFDRNGNNFAMAKPKSPLRQRQRGRTRGGGIAAVTAAAEAAAAAAAAPAAVAAAALETPNL